MGQYLTPGHVYVDGSIVTGPNLTEHVEEASFNPTAITEQELKDPAELTDQILAVAEDEFVQLTLQQIHDLILYPGSVVQTKYGEYTANTDLTNQIPLDDTIPQNTEGTEIISVSITPRFATSTILCAFQGDQNPYTAAWVGAALFKDAVVNAIASKFIYVGVNGASAVNTMSIMDSPATTSAITYRIRVGPSSAVPMRMNGSYGGRHGGGTGRVTLVLQEIKV